MMHGMLVCFSYSLSLCHAVVQAFVFFEQKTDGKDVLRRSAILLALQVCVCVCVRHVLHSAHACTHARALARTNAHVRRILAQNLNPNPKP